MKLIESEMMFKILTILLNVFLILTVFLTGFFSYPVLNFYFNSNLEKPFSFSNNFIGRLDYMENAPSDFLSREDITVYQDKVVINISGATISSYADTGSMSPVLNHNSNGIRVRPQSEKDIEIGDIVSFMKNNILIVHRVIEKGEDSEGIYFLTKGDNNNFHDGKIRFDDIEYLTIGILY